MNSLHIRHEASTLAYELACLRAHICWNPWMPFIWREAERICPLSQRCGECWKMKFKRHVVLVLAIPLSFLPSMLSLDHFDWPIWLFCFRDFSLAHDFPRSPGRNWGLRKLRWPFSSFKSSQRCSSLHDSRWMWPSLKLAWEAGARWCKCRTSPRRYNTKFNPTWLFHHLWFMLHLFVASGTRLKLDRARWCHQRFAGACRLLYHKHRARSRVSCFTTCNLYEFLAPTANELSPTKLPFGIFWHNIFQLFSI